MFGITIIKNFNGKKWGADVSTKDIHALTGAVDLIVARPGTVISADRAPGRVVVWLDKNDRVLSVRVG